MRFWSLTAGVVAVLSVSAGAYGNSSQPDGVQVKGTVVHPAHSAVVSWSDIVKHDKELRKAGRIPASERAIPWMPYRRGKSTPAPQPGKADTQSTPGPVSPKAAKAVGTLAPLLSSFQASRDKGYAIPPDTDGAVGPQYLVTALNDTVTIQTKTGFVVNSVDLNSFWSAAFPNLSIFFDPRIYYDSLSGRFFFLSDADYLSVTSSLVLAVSASSDPTGKWHFYQFQADSTGTDWADYPNGGINSKWFTFTANMFGINSGNFDKVRVWIVQKSDLLSGNPQPHTTMVIPTLGGQPIGFTLVPALTFSSTQPTEYLVSTVINAFPSSSGALRLYTVTGTASVPAFTVTDKTPSSAPWGDYNPGAPQLGSSALINTGDDRILSAVVRDGFLWCAHTVGLPATAPTRTGAKWWQIELPLGLTVQSGVVEDPDTSYYYPSLTVNSAGTVMMAFSGSSENSYASAYYTCHKPSDPLGQMESVGLIKEGAAPYYKIDQYGRNRWGDYSVTCVDPIDDFTMWTIQEYAEVPRNTWSTWWASFNGNDTVKDFRAAPEGSNNTILLSWQGNPTDIIITRKLNAFPTSPYDGSVVYHGSASTPVEDGPLTPGTEYYYGLFADYGSQTYTDKHFYRAIVGDPKTDYLTQEFNGGTDLAFTQFLFSPVYNAAAADQSNEPRDYVNYNDYVVTVTKNVGNLPVPRDNATQLFLADNDFAQIGLPTPFPFFGVNTNTLYLGANGFVTLQSIRTPTSATDSINHPSLASHFEVPRISFLFADLSPRTAGDIWTRLLDDSVVITFDNVPEYGSTVPNTVQAQFFYSGHILITYLGLGVQHAVCGLSDGRGIPLDPLTQLQATSDLSMLGVTSHLTLDPLPFIQANAGDLVSFVATVNNGPASLYVTPLPSSSTFSPSSGAFAWQTSIDTPPGLYHIYLKAVKNGQVASQDVAIALAGSGAVPVASNLEIIPARPQVGQNLTAQYTYSDPLERTASGSIIHWYKNGLLVPILDNQTTVSHNYIAAGDSWYFSVTPGALDTANQTIVYGKTALSLAAKIPGPIQADINGDGQVDATDIQLVINAALGIDISPYNGDVNGDGVVDAVDIQAVINRALVSK